MTVHFAILAHDDPGMLALLVDRLAGHSVLVHLDARVNLEQYKRKHAALHRPNVRFLSDRFSVNWGGFSAVRAMTSVSSALKSENESGSVVFLSGHCYPLRPIADFIEYLETHNGLMCRAYGLGSHPDAWHYRRISHAHWFELRGSLKRIMPGPLAGSIRRLLSASRLGRPVLPDLEVYAGSQWMALPLACLREATEAVEGPAYSFLRNSYAPDEMAIQSFVYNSRWRPSETVDARFVSKISDISNYHYLKPSMSGKLNIDDVDKALASRQYFVRKVFSENRDVIRKIHSSTDAQ